jgi:protein-disulfide isomerase
MSLPEGARFVAFAEQAQLFDFFAARGISTDQARQCLADGAAMRTLAERLQAQTQEDGVTGTPTFFLNGANIGTHTWATLEPILREGAG